jgi:hypothetical protein
MIKVAIIWLGMQEALQAPNFGMARFICPQMELG